MKKYNLMQLSEAELLSQKELVRLYAKHINPGIGIFLRVLGFDEYKIVKAEGMYIYTECGKKILDFSGGMSVLNHGHNHPRILEARRRFNQNKRLEICKAFISGYQSVLAKNLAEIFPGDLQYSFFCNSGAEANEGALKIALLFHRPHRDKIIYTDIGYHGKTFAAMSVSGLISRPYKELFKSMDGCLEVPYGDIGALRRLIRDRESSGQNDIACMILEPIKGDLVITPPKGYLQELSTLCEKNGIILIADEIFTGFGKTGKMFGFEHEGIVPDIVTFSKSLGGGKASIAGYIVKPRIFEKTYGSLKNCTIHTTTFGGMGEECASAIEALNIINDEDLVENARLQGEYLLAKMKTLKAKYPRYIREVRGIGLLCIFELYNTSEVFGKGFFKNIPHIDDFLLGLIPAAIVSELFKKHNILLYTGGREDNLFISPALIITPEEIDIFIEALDKVLNGNMLRLIMELANNLIF
ncbi:MAG: aminotransferase class III-fold pyridoxal phosphate-dependent enzyme [Candidatus Omnitrophica bacterium]|nr:aminotransferase class III-fold pyridoxal phosphate-dependent enzyme [Candidatus Omnitrophota bacterium]